MDSRLVIFYIIELILLTLLYLLINYFLILKRRIKIRNRFLKYSVYKTHKETNFFDDFFLLFENFVKKISKFLYKMKIFDKYSLKYLKYIKAEDKTKIDKMDFVSRKLIVSILFIFIVIVVDIIKGSSITLIQILFTFLVGFHVLDLLLISSNKLLDFELENDLLKAITIMNNSFKSGRSIMQSIKLVSDELNSPLGLEFKKMYVDLTYGLSLEVVFKRFEQRVNLPDVHYITTSLMILNETGGDIVKVFESVEKTFFNNKKLKDELKNLTASSKFLYYVLLFIPIIFTLIIFILDNTYFNPLFKSPFGYFVIILCLVLYISYILIIKKIMKLGDSYGK